ncbi:MAG: hypothetical protein KDJ97_02230 [Anaerolineae bacterium]|nr:hypothetical protein [Anaerolineae bacterium]
MKKTNKGSTGNKTIFTYIKSPFGAIGFVLIVVVLAVGLISLLASRNSQTQLGSQPPSSTPTVTRSQTSITSPQNTASKDLSTNLQVIATPSVVVSTELTAHTGWKTFSSELGFSFEYPAQWGKVTENIVDNEEQQNGYTGKSYSLTFSAFTEDTPFYNFAGAVGHSADYSASRGVYYNDYKGDPSQPTQVTAEIFMVSYPCPSFNLPYHGVVDFNLPGREISGVRLIVPGISESDIAKFNKILNVNFTKLDTCDDPTINSKAQQLYLTMKNEKQFNDETLRNITIYEKIAKSSKLLQ